MIPVQKIYDATRQGLDIILWLYPQASECIGVKGKKFKVRDEKTPSACLYQRKSDKYGEVWGVTDFGGEGWRSAIQLYMEDHHLSQDRFNEAVLQIAAHFNVTDELDRSGMTYSLVDWAASAKFTNMLRKGDTLYITSLDRLARDKHAIQQELQYYRDRGVIVRILDVPTTLMDFSQYGTLQKSIMDMVNNILIEVLGTMAEQEITIKRKRQREGIDAAKARGKHLGRPRAACPANWQTEYTAWQRKEITAREAMRRLQLKPSTFYNLVQRAKAQADNPSVSGGDAR